ncbi:MAG: dehydrogenase, partial [Euryarchaeota archaeon]|nr:dehydrogenase [Euryarchaeota archaeon]
MKILVQNLKNGETFLEDVPNPRLSKNGVLIQTSYSLVSLGTERTLVEFGKSNLIQKARQQPEKVLQVLDKIRSDGLLPTMEVVFNRLDQPLPLGYCNVGKVIEVGSNVTEFCVGDRVASNGNHSEIVSSPKNLVAKIPKNVTDEEATFTVIGSIGLQGMRLLEPTYGETIVVYGLGLVGLITCQLLKANGCNAIGIDIDEVKCQIAKKWCIDTINPNLNDPIKTVSSITGGVGCDGVIITASNKSNKIISSSAQMSRKRGRIILVGVVGLNLNRSDFYEKELSFQVSCSYGPGRYDSQYEDNGVDYPLPYIRWTEKRNFETILQSLEKNILDVKGLITEKVKLEDYREIYDNMRNKNSIGSVLVYPKSNSKLTNKTIKINQRKYPDSKGVIGIIGAGNFTSATILPLLKRANAKIKCIVSSSGLTGTRLAKKYGISKSSTDYKEIFKDDEIDSVIITTRHDTHAKFVLESLEMGKNTFVEKPLCLDLEELNKIENLLFRLKTPMLTVGFNRRFSPHLKLIKNSIGENSGPINITATMNAGHISSDHWVQDFELGGG